jgi:hypothetical protein
MSDDTPKDHSMKVFLFCVMAITIGITIMVISIERLLV